jgi:hypothetical protein
MNRTQVRFLQIPNKFSAYVGGFGSGKTWSGCTKLAIHALQNPGITQGYFAPTYPLIRDIFYPTIEEVAQTVGMRSVARVGNHEVDLYLGRRLYSTVICRTMDKPENIVGFKIGNAVIDEIDILDKAKAERAWNKVIARMRFKGMANRIGVTTTPEGFRFTYQRFKRDPSDSYGMVQASTYENEHNLPDDYIDSLLESYPDNLIAAYIDGEFTNLQSGSVYPMFDRFENRSTATLEFNEPLHIGMDFNVLKMAAVVHVIRDGLPIAVDEITDGRDTPYMIDLFEQRYKGHHITVYPDASGGSTSSKGASLSDISLLRTAGYSISAPKANPPIRNRVIAMNAMFCNAVDQRRYKINSEKCPHYTEALEQQAYDKNGEPDKSTGHDHIADAGGYFIHQRYPLKPRMRSRELAI